MVSIAFDDLKALEDKAKRGEVNNSENGRLRNALREKEKLIATLTEGNNLARIDLIDCRQAAARLTREKENLEADKHNLLRMLTLIFGERSQEDKIELIKLMRENYFDSLGLKETRDMVQKLWGLT